MVLVVIMLVNLNRLLVRYRDWVWRCHWYRHFNTDGDFNTDRNVDRYFYSDWNLDRNLDGNVLDDGDLDGNGLRDGVGLGDWNGLRHSVRDSVGLRDGDRCSNWVGDTVAVAFAESFFKTLFIVMGLERSFIGRQTHSL
jgi:hypothetical protein